MKFDIAYDYRDEHRKRFVEKTLAAVGHVPNITTPGSNIVYNAHQNERCFAILSQNFVEHAEQNEVWAWYFYKDPRGRAQLLVPLLFENCDLQGLLGPIMYVDLRGFSVIQKQALILASAQPKRAKPATAPKFPVRLDPDGAMFIFGGDADEV